MGRLSLCPGQTLQHRERKRRELLGLFPRRNDRQPTSPVHRQQRRHTRNGHPDTHHETAVGGRAPKDGTYLTRVAPQMPQPAGVHHHEL